MDKSTKIEVPVLVIGFNRPNVLRTCIAKLAESKPCNLYFACDGPRINSEGEASLVNEVRSVMENEVDWSCTKHYRYNENNKGCEVTESEAISWVLEENEYVIVVEDDIIAPYSFLKFAQEMLYKYKDESNIYQVTSDNTTPMAFPDNEDYCFSRYGHIWGWATWKRAWKHFDLYVTDFEMSKKKIPSRNDLTTQEKKRFKYLCERLIREENKKQTIPKHTWDYIWSYVKWRDGGLSIVPRVHLSSNIGIDGLHTKSQGSNHYMAYEEEFEAKTHPKVIKCNRKYDDYHYNKHLKRAPFVIHQWKRGLNYLKRQLLQKRTI